MTNRNKRTPRRQSLPRRTNPRPRPKQVEVRPHARSPRLPRERQTNTQTQRANVRPTPRRTPRERKRNLEKSPSPSRKASLNQVSTSLSHRILSTPFLFSAPTKKRRGTTSGVTSRGFQTVISLLHDQICQLRNGSIFHGPVKVSDAPDYYEIVKRAIDLKAIKTKIRDGRVTDSYEYQRDVFLMFANSMMYNRPDSDLYKMAEEVSPNLFSSHSHSYLPSPQMMLESEALIGQLRQTENRNN
jgi:bromodomain-containing protein 8